jgi:hypothetical protein
LGALLEERAGFVVHIIGKLSRSLFFPNEEDFICNLSSVDVPANVFVVRANAIAKNTLVESLSSSRNVEAVMRCTVARGCHAASRIGSLFCVNLCGVCQKHLIETFCVA